MISCNRNKNSLFSMSTTTHARKSARGEILYYNTQRFMHFAFLFIIYTGFFVARNEVASFTNPSPTKTNAYDVNSFFAKHKCLPSSKSISATSIFSRDKKEKRSTKNYALFMSPQSSSSSQYPLGKSGSRMVESYESFVELTFNKTDNLEDSLPLLVFFTAPWCGPCRLSNPVVKEIRMEFQNELEVLEVDTDDFPEIASDAGVVSIPTIQIYHGGKCLDTIIGCVAKNVLSNAVKKSLEDIGELSSGKDKI